MTWLALIDTLRDVGLIQLACDIEGNKYCRGMYTPPTSSGPAPATVQKNPTGVLSSGHPHSVWTMSVPPLQPSGEDLHPTSSELERKSHTTVVQDAAVTPLT